MGYKELIRWPWPNFQGQSSGKTENSWCVCVGGGGGEGGGAGQAIFVKNSIFRYIEFEF